MDNRAKVVSEINRRLAQRGPMATSPHGAEMINSLVLVLQLADIRMHDAVRSGPNTHRAILATRNEIRRLMDGLTGMRL